MTLRDEFMDSVRDDIAQEGLREAKRNYARQVLIEKAKAAKPMEEKPRLIVPKRKGIILP